MAQEARLGASLGRFGALQEQRGLVAERLLARVELLRAPPQRLPRTR